MSTSQKLYQYFTIFSLSRIFYFIEISRPTKLEVVLHEEDVRHPTNYALKFLPPSLAPNFNKLFLNEGKYVCVQKTDRVSVYFFHFNKTIAASKEDLDIAAIIECHAEVDDIIPPCDDVSFSKFQVPWGFIGINDLLVLLQERRQKMLKKPTAEQVLLSPTPALPPPTPALPPSVSASVQALSLTGSDEMRHERFGIWLRDNLKGYIIRTNKLAQAPYYSRFSRSNGDFSFFRIACNDVVGASVTISKKDDSEEEDSEEEDSEEDDSEEDDSKEADEDCDGLGDKKDSAAVSDTNQLMANMGKTVADVALEAVNSCIFFKNITVYGLLVDYTSHVAKSIYKLKLDFTKKKSYLYKCDDSKLPIEEAFERVTSILNRAVI